MKNRTRSSFITGTDLTIKELAALIQKIVGHTGEIIWDSNKPDGTPRKLMDFSKMSNAGWRCPELTPLS